MSGATEMRTGGARSRRTGRLIPADPSVLEYCEPGEEDFSGFSPEQYEFCRSGVNVQTLNLFGWLFGGGDRRGELPYKLIRSIIVCGVHHEMQVEFAAYVAYNKHFGLLRDAGAFTGDGAAVLEVLPTNNSSNPDPSKFDPKGFASYCERHGLFQKWRRCYITTCNATTGKTALGLDVPEQTVRGAPVGKSYFYNNSRVSTRQKSQTVYDTMLQAWQELQERVRPPQRVGSLLLPRPPRYLGYDIANAKDTATNVRILAKKSLLTRPRQRYSLQWSYTPIVGFPVTKQNCIDLIVEWDCAHKRDEELVSQKTKEIVRVQVTGARAQRKDISLCNGLYQEYQARNAQISRSNYFTKGDVCLFLMQIGSEKMWVFAEETTYDLYQSSLQSNKKLDMTQAKIIATSKQLPQGQINIDGIQTLQWFVRKPKSQDESSATTGDKKNHKSLVEYADAWNSVQMFKKWQALKARDGDVDRAWNAIRKWRFFRLEDGQPMAQQKSSELMQNTALGEEDEVHYARVYLEVQALKRELSAWMSENKGIVSTKQIDKALQEAEKDLAKVAAKLKKQNIDVPTTDQLDDLLSQKAAPSANVEVIAGFNCVPVDAINVRLQKETIVTNQEELDQFNDMAGRRVRILTRLRGKDMDWLAPRLLRYLAYNEADLLEMTNFARLKQSYLQRMREWQSNGDLRNVQIQTVSETVVLLQGEGKSRQIRKVNTLAYSCLDECCVDFYKESDEEWKAYYGGFNFQLLAFESKEQTLFHSYLRAVLSAFCAKAPNGAELFQFQNLNAVQTLLLNQWYRAMTDQEAVDSYIEGYINTRMRGESNIQRMIANALNLNIVELRLAQNMNLDSEKRAFDLVVLARYTSMDNYIDKHWLPESPGFDKTKFIFSTQSTESNTLAKPITVYVLNMHDSDTDNLDALRSLLPAAQRNRLDMARDPYRTLLATHFHLGVQIADPNVYKAFMKRGHAYDTTRGDLLRIPDTPNNYDDEDPEVTDLDNQTYKLSEHSGFLGMVKAISLCLDQYAKDMHNPERFHSAENQELVNEFGGLNTYSDEKPSVYLAVLTSGWKGMLDPKAVNLKVITRFVDYFKSQEKKRKDKANENNKALHEYLINPDLLRLLDGFLLRLRQRYPGNHAEDMAAHESEVNEREDFAKYFIDDLKVLAAIYNLQIRLVEDHGKFDCNSVCETVLPALPVWLRKGKNGQSVPWWGGAHNWMTDTPDGQGRAPLVVTLLYKESKYDKTYPKFSGRIYWRFATKVGAFNLSNQAGIAQQRGLTRAARASEDSENDSDEADWERRDRAKSGIVRAPVKRKDKGREDRAPRADGRAPRPDPLPGGGAAGKKPKVKPKGGDDFVSGGGGGGRGVRIRVVPLQPSGAHGEACNHDEEYEEDYDDEYADVAEKLDRIRRHYGRGGGGQGARGRAKENERRSRSDATQDDNEAENTSGDTAQGGPRQQQVDDEGYRTVNYHNINRRYWRVYVEMQRYKETEKRFREQADKRKLTATEERLRYENLSAIEYMETLYARELDKIDKFKKQGLLAPAFQGPVQSLGAMMQTSGRVRHFTVAQGREKEIFFLTMALGQMAAIVQILENNGWATFKIHTGQTEQSRYLATMIRPFFEQMECYPISKQYTSHILVVALGFRRPLAERVNLADLLMSCGSLDANEMRMVCEHIEALAYQHKAIRQEDYAAYKLKVYKTSCKMYMDWFDHNVAISKAYIQATLEGRVSPAPGYLRPEIAELLNRRVFSRVHEATRQKNLQLLRAIMATPFMEQLRPLFVSAPPLPKALHSPTGDSDSGSDSESDMEAAFSAGKH